VLTNWGPPGLIALDIDGTIVDTGRPVSARVLAAIRRAVDSGVHLVLATGRSVIGTRPMLTELGLNSGNVLCSNGAVRMDAATGTLLEVHRFDARPLVAHLRSLLPGVLFSVEKLGEPNMITGEFPLWDSVAPSRLVDHATLVAEPITRLTAWWQGHTAEEMTTRVRASDLPPAYYTLDTEGPWLVAVPDGMSKGVALERLRRELGVPADATLAVGDGANDIEMLQWAAYGVAMGHAPEPVRSAARAVTAPIHADGLAHILERWYH
jgi:hydroxymethylpyrimidine pyrophosphatase-like HAD family hydrolase